NLLLRGLCSTVPGLVQIRNRPTTWGDDGCRHRWHRPTAGLVCRRPQTCKNLWPTGCLGFTALDELEGLITELIAACIRVDRTIRPGTGIKTRKIWLHLGQA